MKRSLIIIGLFVLKTMLFAQTYVVEERAPQKKSELRKGGFQKENLRFGGNFGAAFGTISVVEISPVVGYQFHRMFIAGVGLNYQYYSDNSPIAQTVYGGRYTQNIYGGQVFAEFHPIRNFFLHAELGTLNHDVSFTNEKNLQWVAYPLVGGGLMLPVGPRSGLTLMLLFNLNDQEYSIYSNPIMRIGFSVGI